MFRLCVVACSMLAAGVSVHAADKPNVLFIAVDDLNHWVGHLHRNPQTKTPHIDQLAKLGVTFTRSYCAAPVCNPSRAALMSGQRPGETGVYDNGQDWKPVISQEKTLTTQFLNAGYNVFGAGKIYHGSAHRDGEWSEYFDRTGGNNLKLHPDAKNDGVDGIKFGPLDNEDADMPDYKTVSYGLEKLNAKHDKPFFLAIGLAKPHMPFSVPKKYFDQFPLESIELPPHREGDLSDVPPAGVRMAKPTGDHAAILRSGRWKEAVQAYLASIAFCDAMVGRLMDGLEKSPYRDNTVIVFWGDHGWHLGEKEHWRKFALWEEATRAPMIWVAPGITKPGGVCDRTVDFMSIYPTLCDLAGISIPSHVKGASLQPLLTDPKAKWDQPGITTFHKDNHGVRTEGWRYIRYADGGEELYDETADPYEWTNLASDPKHSARKSEMAKWLPRENAPELPRGDAGSKTAPKKKQGKLKKAVDKLKAKTG